MYRSGVMDLMDSGACHSFGPVYYSSSDPNEDTIAAEWLIYPIANVMVLAEIFKRAAEAPGIPIELDMSIKFGPETKGWASDGFSSTRSYPPIQEVEIGPFAWTQRSEMQSILAEVEYQLFSAFGRLSRQATRVNFDAVFDSVEIKLREALMRSKPLND